MNIELNEDYPTDFPSGSMFWARSRAIEPLLDLNLRYEDFPEEASQVDGTVAHAIEHLFFHVCERAGFDWIKVARPEMFRRSKAIFRHKIDDIQSFIASAGRKLICPKLERRSVTPATKSQSTPQEVERLRSSDCLVLLELTYDRCIRPADFGASGDTRALAIGFERIEVTCLETGSHLGRFDFDSASNSKPHLLYGFYDAESWGIWSSGHRTAMVLPLAAKPCGRLRIFVKHQNLNNIGGRLSARARARLDKGPYVEVEFRNQETSFDIDHGANDLAERFRNNLSSSDDTKIALSIVIPTYHRDDLLYSCITSIGASVLSVPYEIIVINNGEAPSLRRDTQLPTPIIDVNLDVRASFGSANNIASGLARGEFILLLNNDTFLEPGVVDALLMAMTDCGIGAAGPAFYYPDGSLQELGGQVSKNCIVSRPTFNGMNWNPVLTRDVDYISAACLLIRREAFRRVGGFDPAIAYYGEDVDLCLRLRMFGWRTRLVGSVAVVHIEGATSASGCTLDSRALSWAKNAHILQARWGRWLLTCDDADAPHIPRPDIDAWYGTVSHLPKEIHCVVSEYPLAEGDATEAIGIAVALGHGLPTALVTRFPASDFDVFHRAQAIGLKNDRISLQTHSAIDRNGVDVVVVTAFAMPVAAPTYGRLKVLHCPFPDWSIGTQRDVLRGQVGALLNFDAIITESEYAQREILSALNILGVSDIRVDILPAHGVALSSHQESDKDDLVLSIGPLNAKLGIGGHEAVIRTFEEIATLDRKRNWRLVILGDLGTGDDPTYVEHLRARGRQFCVDVLVSPPRELFCKLLNRAKICLLLPDAEAMNRRSIMKVVSAISAGCLPVVSAETGEGLFCARERIGSVYGTVEKMNRALAEAMLVADGSVTQEQKSRMEAYSESARVSAWNELIQQIASPSRPQIAEGIPTPALIPLGCRGSGMSLMARVLSIAGAALPNDARPARALESADISAWNDVVLRESKLAWNDPFAAGKTDMTEVEISQAEHLIGLSFGTDRPVVLNDHRLSLLLPLWDTALQSSGYRPVYIVMLRDPRHVAAALQDRFGLPFGRGLLLWARRTLVIERRTRGLERLFVSYDEFVADGLAAVERISSKHSVHLRRNARTSEAIGRFLQAQPQLRIRAEPWNELHASHIRNFYESLREESIGGGVTVIQTAGDLEQWLDEMQRFVM